MSTIQFVSKHEDLSTDRGYQFKFYCDKCGGGYMSRLQPSEPGAAGSLLRAASDVFGGWLGGEGNPAQDVQRAVGGRAHEEALRKAVEEGKAHFRQCSRCGRWVCPEACWNAASGQCEECPPDHIEQLASPHSHAEADAAHHGRPQEKIRATDHASDIDAGTGATVKPPSAATVPTPHASDSTRCLTCGSEVGRARFCPECGTPVKTAQRCCPSCGHEPEGNPKFCPECGTKM